MVARMWDFRRRGAKVIRKGRIFAVGAPIGFPAIFGGASMDGPEH